MSLDVEDPREGGEEEEADTAAEERPAWRPDALDDGADPGEVQDEAGDGEQRACDQEPLNGNLRSRRAKPLARAQAEQHGAQRGYEAECEISTAVVQEARCTRQEVQEPDVKCLPEVAVLVPVRGEAGEVVVPIRGY